MPAVAEFRKAIPRSLRRVSQGQSVRLTKHGRLVAVLRPPTEEELDEELGKNCIRELKRMKGKKWLVVEDARDLNKLFG